MPAIHVPGQPAPTAPLSPGYAAGGWVYVSGQVANQPDGGILVGDFAAEVNGTLDNVEKVLAAGGATWDDVVRVGVYLSNSLLFAEFNELYAQRLGDHRPARSAIIVDFGHPNVRVEVDAVAYIGS